MSAGDNPRFVVTSLEAPSPQMLYEDLYCTRGNCEKAIKAVKQDLHSDRTSATSCLAKAMRLLLACAASVLHHALRTPTLQHTALAQAQPSPIILTLFRVTTQSKQYNDRMRLHLPRSCPVKALLHRVTTRLCAIPEPVCNTSSAARRPMPRAAASGSYGASLQRLDRRRRGQVLLVATPLRGRGARVGGSRSLLPLCRAPQNSSYRTKIPTVSLPVDEIHCSMCSATVYETRLGGFTAHNNCLYIMDQMCCNTFDLYAHCG
jgi:hypothetical protein